MQHVAHTHTHVLHAKHMRGPTYMACESHACFANKHNNNNNKTKTCSSGRARQALVNGGVEAHPPANTSTNNNNNKTRAGKGELSLSNTLLSRHGRSVRQENQEPGDRGPRAGRPAAVRWRHGGGGCRSCGVCPAPPCPAMPRRWQRGGPRCLASIQRAVEPTNKPAPLTHRQQWWWGL